jgi:glyoxylase-like metal-dependent hydrolase (beta-lactamase superfamily II)
MTQPHIRAFFDEPTKTVTYLVWDPATLCGVVIDAVRDFDAASGAVGSRSVDAVLAAAAAEGVRVEWALETHVHADHLSGAPLVRARTGAKIAIGEQVCDVQAAFGPMFDIEPEACGETFDRLLADGDRLTVGEMVIDVLHVPGHTPADVAYLIGDAAFVGDTLFMPDFGTARTDFPGGCAHQLYRSIRRLLDLPPETRLFLCHDYKAPGRDHFAWETTVAAQRAGNKHVHEGVSEDEFVAMRQARDAQLPAPALLMPAIQCNIRAGRLPPADAERMRHLRIPLSLQPGASPDALD